MVPLDLPGGAPMPYRDDEAALRALKRWAERATLAELHAALERNAALLNRAGEKVTRGLAKLAAEKELVARVGITRGG